LLATVLLIAATLTGCTSSSPETPADLEEPLPAASAGDVTAIETMGPQEKRETIAANFPLEIPVALGEVVRGEAQGEDAWDYELLVDAPPAAVAEWYRQTYAGRSWVVAAERPASSPDGGQGTEITLQKGDAQSRITVFSDGEGARVLAIVGVGAPVLQTQ
jgi:hypothetical protein